MRALVLALLFLAAMLGAGRGRAQEQELPAVLRVPADDPRKGPRLEYTRGPVRCPDEKTFRREVAYWVDGRDHLAADSPALVRVRFAWAPDGYTGSVEYTDAAGKKAETLKVTRDGDHCPMLARWVALKVARRVPKKPPPEPCPACKSCPAPSECAACPACAASEPAPPSPPIKQPWYMDLTVGLRAYGMMTSLLTADVGGAVGVGVDLQGAVISVGGELRVALPSRVYATEPVPGASSYFQQEFDLSLCLYGEGDLDCPPGWQRSVYYLGVQDDRGCTACGCEPPGAQCEAYVIAYSDSACDVPAGSVIATVAEPACFDVPSGIALGSVEASFLGQSPGSCASTGGAPTGAIAPDEPVTLCCRSALVPPG